MDGFTRRKEKSKEEIRKAAWDLFSQFGVERVSMVDIARKAGVSQATIYNNFESKETLAREFVARMIAQLVERVQEVLKPEKPYQEKLEAFFQLISKMMAQGRPFAAEHAVFMGSVDRLNDPEIKQIREAARETMTDLLLGLVQEGKAQGQIETEVSDPALGIYFKAFMDIFSNPELQEPFSRDPKIVHELGALMLYGLNGQKGAEK